MTSKYLQMELRTSPHIARETRVDIIMKNVVYSLIPIVAMSVYAFGLSALLLVLACTLSAVLTEHLLGRLSGKAGTLGDYSAVITGILLGLTLPPGFPLWMAVVGGVVSIAIGKTLFGGLGFNVFNPALVGRAFLQAAFPVAITTWSEPFAQNRFAQAIAASFTPPFSKLVPDAATGATPLAAMKFDQQLAATQAVLFGTVSGSAGETSALLILLCGAYLALRKMLDWRIPVGILVTVYLLSGLFHLITPTYPPPLFMLLSGGLMLGAIFMATDMVTCPVTSSAVWIFATLVGTLTVVIRLWGGLPEGVMYAILLGNALTPVISRLTQPRVYGVARQA
jgi:electron transport complex protein RnfD